MPIISSKEKNKRVDTFNGMLNEIDHVEKETDLVSIDVQEKIQKPIKEERKERVKKTVAKPVIDERLLTERRTVYFAREKLLELEGLRYTLLTKGTKRNISELIDEAIALLIKKYN